MEKVMSWQPHTTMLMLLLMLNLIDYHTTALIINEGGIELNPLMNHVIVVTGMIWPILAIKMSIVGIMWWGYELATDVSLYLYVILASVIGIYTAVVARSVNFCIEYGLL